MKTLRERIWKYKIHYLMMIPCIVFLICFKYLPMSGIILAFKNFKFAEGIIGSPWVGFENFEFFFMSDSGWRAIGNTIILNSLFIIFHTAVALLLAILLNEVRGRWFKKGIQTAILFPYFISWMVVGVFAYNMLNYEFGSVNHLLSSLGLEKQNLYSSPEHWQTVLVIVDVWKNSGYGMVIYLAALTAIDQSIYDAALIDGASKFTQTFKITIPLIMPTVTTMVLLAVGKIMNTDFGMFYGIVGDNSILYPTTDVLDTFVYRNLRKIGDIGMSSAAALFQSFVGFAMVLLSNHLVRKYQEEGALF